jgi:hypothetical protein
MNNDRLLHVRIILPCPGNDSLIAAEVCKACNTVTFSHALAAMQCCNLGLLPAGGNLKI